MANEIEKIREDLEQGMRVAREWPEERAIEESPCGRYQLDVQNYATADLPDCATIAVATVRSATTGEVLVTVKRNDTRCFYAWISRDGHDYLLFPEDLEGQTVIDLTTREVAGYSSPDDPFIWAEYYPSPHRSRLAVIGCYWACPYQVTVYDFAEPLRVPLPKLAEFVLPRNDAKFVEWISADALSMVDPDGSVSVFNVAQRTQPAVKGGTGEV